MIVSNWSVTHDEKKKGWIVTKPALYQGDYPRPPLKKNARFCPSSLLATFQNWILKAIDLELPHGGTPKWEEGWENTLQFITEA